jgi:hypothetical protein
MTGVYQLHHVEARARVAAPCADGHAEHTGDVALGHARISRCSAYQVMARSARTAARVVG